MIGFSEAKAPIGRPRRGRLQFDRTFLRPKQSVVVRLPPRPAYNVMLKNLSYDHPARPVLSLAESSLSHIVCAFHETNSNAAVRRTKSPFRIRRCDSRGVLCPELDREPSCR